MPPDLDRAIDDHYQNLYRFAISLTRSSDDAWDLTQDAFLKLMKHRSRIQNAAAVKSWLYTTLYRDFLKLARKESRTEPLENPDLEQAPAASSESYLMQAEAADVMQALMGLKDSYRQVISLFYLESYSYKEISEILEIPIGTVMSRLSRGKEMLKSILERASIPSEVIDFEKHKGKVSNG